MSNRKKPQRPIGNRRPAARASDPRLSNPNLAVPVYRRPGGWVLILVDQGGQYSLGGVYSSRELGDAAVERAAESLFAGWHLADVDFDVDLFLEAHVDNFQPVAGDLDPGPVPNAG